MQPWQHLPGVGVDSSLRRPPYVSTRLNYRDSCLHQRLQTRSARGRLVFTQGEHRFLIAPMRCRVHSSESTAGKIAVKQRRSTSRAAKQRLRGLCGRYSWLAVSVVSFYAFPFLTAGLAACLTAHTAAQEALISNALMFVFMPVTCVLWALLMATTIDRLWARLQELESLLVQEATVFSEFVPALLTACSALPPDSRHELMRLAENYRVYMKRLLNGREEDTFQPLSEDFRSQAVQNDPLVKFWAVREAVSRCGVQQGKSLRRAEDQLDKLTELRSRRALVQFQTVPKRVLVILMFLSFLCLGSLCAASVESSVDRVVAIHSVRLRVMFSSMCCFLAVLRELVGDLGNPVSGKFSVSAANRIGRRILVRPGRMLREAMDLKHHASSDAT